jgi:hypothetical protein
MDSALAHVAQVAQSRSQLSSALRAEALLKSAGFPEACSPKTVSRRLIPKFDPEA